MNVSQKSFKKTKYPIHLGILSTENIIHSGKLDEYKLEEDKWF